MVELHAQPAVNGIELHLRKADHLFPNGDVFGIAGLEFHEFGLGLFEAGGIRIALGVDDLVEAFQFGNGIAFERRAVQGLCPADQQLAKLRAPVTNMIVRNDVMPQQPQRALEGIANAGGTDVAHVHGLGHVRGAEINDHGFGRGGAVEKQVFAPHSRGKIFRELGGFETEIQEPGTGNLHFFARVGQIQFGEHIGGELARIEFPGLGEGHQGVALVITKFGFGTGADENDGDIRIRQNRQNGGLQANLNLFMRQHGEIKAWMHAVCNLPGRLLSSIM